MTSVARGVERERESWRGRSSRAPRSVAVERACEGERERRRGWMEKRMRWPAPDDLFSIPTKQRRSRSARKYTPPRVLPVLSPLSPTSPKRGRSTALAPQARARASVSNSQIDDDNDDNYEQRQRRHNDNNNDVCTVWRSCVAGNPPPLGKVEGQVVVSQSLLPYDGLLEQEYLNLPLSQIGGACI